MTVSSSPSRELNIGEICALAYRRAGILSPYQMPDAQRMKAAMQDLQLIIDSLQAKGVMARARGDVTVEVEEGASSVSLPSNVLEVINQIAFIDRDEDIDAPTRETRVNLISQGEWSQGSRSVEGVPTRVYVDRSSDALLLRLLPICQYGGWLRVPVQRLLASATSAGNTVELERPWAQYLVYALGAELARSNALPLQRVMDLQTNAAQELRMCMGFNSNRAATQIRFRHGRRR